MLDPLNLIRNTIGAASVVSLSWGEVESTPLAPVGGSSLSLSISVSQNSSRRMPNSVFKNDDSFVILSINGRRLEIERFSTSTKHRASNS